MNKLQNQIDEMKVKLSEMEAELAKSEEFKFEYAQDSTYVLLGTTIADGWNGVDQSRIKHGCYRKTAIGATQALKLNMQMNRLHAAAEQLSGLKEFELNRNNYYVYFDETNRRYMWNNYQEMNQIGTVWMTNTCAKELCELLNSGKLKLEV